VLKLLRYSPEQNVTPIHLRVRTIKRISVKKSERAAFYFSTFIDPPAAAEAVLFLFRIRTVIKFS
jgi:hypothetical protein